MYKVVIIDDEPIIVRGLSQMIPWEKYDCEVVGTAGDGQGGLEVIRREQPDLVFSDIYMPKMNGLLMAAALRSEYEHMEITILTGYRDFDLLQEALRLGVTRYVLKPSKLEELEEALGAMLEKLKKREDIAARTARIEQMAAEEESEQAVGATDISDGNAPDSGEQQQKTAEKTGGTDSDTHEAGSFIVTHALEYMKDNYKSKLTLQDVADHTYVSQWHLSKLLNRHTGKSFSELLNSIRVDEAKTLLADPSLRVGDVAEMVGFLDMAHFSRVFKKMTGMSANEFRNLL